MTTTVTCSAGYGRGGVGQHFAQVVEDARAEGGLGRYLTPAVRPGDPLGEVVPARLGPALGRYTPLRFAPAAWGHVADDLFDRAAARRLAAPPGRVVGFVGQALRTFRRARALGAARLELMALNTHPDHVLRQHAAARAAWPLEPTWLSAAAARKMRAEIALADAVWVHSDLVAETYRAAGVPAAALRRLHLRVDPRFGPPAARPADGVFRVVYVGRLSVDKGVPVLLEAFRRLDRPDAELALVGGWATRGMRRHVEAALAADPRVRLAPGDPLPHLHRADVYVQPSYEDGFGYAVAEALACSVFTVVTDQTGAKERVRDGETGAVLPAGDVDALADTLAALARRGVPPGR